MAELRVRYPGSMASCRALPSAFAARNGARCSSCLPLDSAYALLAAIFVYVLLHGSLLPPPCLNAASKRWVAEELAPSQEAGSPTNYT